MSIITLPKFKLSAIKFWLRSNFVSSFCPVATGVFHRGDFFLVKKKKKSGGRAKREQQHFNFVWLRY